MFNFSYLKDLLIKRWSALFLLLLLIFFSIKGKGFFDLENFQDIFLASITILILGIGQTLVIITGGIDLSVGFTMGFSSVIMAIILRDLTLAGFSCVYSIPIAIGVSLLIGVIVGLINGSLVGYLGVPPFIATLGVYGIAHGLGLIVSGGFPVANLPDIVSSLGNRYLFYYLEGKFFTFFGMPENIPHRELREVIRILPLMAIVVIAIAIFMIVVLSKTQFGKHTYVIGCSKDVARRAGIKVKSHLLKIYCISSVFAALGGIIFTFRYGSGNVEAGAGYMLNSIAAVVIGGASLYGGTGDIQGTIVGSLIIGTLYIGLVILGIQPFYQYIAIGAVIITGVLIDQLTGVKI